MVQCRWEKNESKYAIIYGWKYGCIYFIYSCG